MILPPMVDWSSLLQQAGLMVGSPPVPGLHQQAAAAAAAASVQQLDQSGENYCGEAAGSSGGTTGKEKARSSGAGRLSHALSFSVRGGVAVSGAGGERRRAQLAGRKMTTEAQGGGLGSTPQWRRWPRLRPYAKAGAGSVSHA